MPTPINRQVNYKPSAADILALETQLTTAYNDQFDAVPQTYTKIATVIPMDERGMSFAWLTSDDDLEEFDPNVGRVIKFLEAHNARIEVRKFTKTLGLTFEDLRDGKLTTAILTAAGIGRSTKRHPDRLVYGVLKNNGMCYDRLPLFDDAHPQKVDQDDGGPTFSNQNTGGAVGAPYWYLLRPEAHPVLFGVRNGEGYSFSTLGADSDNGFLKEQILFGVRARVTAAGGLPQFAYRSNKPLTAENLEAAVAAMEGIKGPEGQPISNSPTVLVVPKSLRASSKQLILGDRNDKGGYNPWFGAMELIVSDYL